MTFQTFVERLGQADMLETVWSITSEYFRSRGGVRVSYRHLRGEPAADLSPTIYHDGFPEAFAERFMAEKLYLDNPLPGIALRTTEPFYWSDAKRMADLSEAELRLLDILREELPGEGLTMQVFGPDGRMGNVSLGFGETTPRLDANTLRELQMAAQAAHLAYCRISGPDESDEPLSMTPRELEVLDWIARGKSNSVIADILGISGHTVDTHVRRIFRKLGVNDRTTAAIKGVGAGLLQVAA